MQIIDNRMRFLAKFSQNIEKCSCCKRDMDSCTCCRSHPLPGQPVRCPVAWPDNDDNYTRTRQDQHPLSD